MKNKLHFYVSSYSKYVDIMFILYFLFFLILRLMSLCELWKLPLLHMWFSHAKKQKNGVFIDQSSSVLLIGFSNVCKLQIRIHQNIRFNKQKFINRYIVHSTKRHNMVSQILYQQYLSWYVKHFKNIIFVLLTYFLITTFN